MSKDTYQYRNVEDKHLIDFQPVFKTSLPEFLAEEAGEHYHSNGGHDYWHDQDSTQDFEIYRNGKSLGIIRVALYYTECFTASKLPAESNETDATN